MLEVYLIVSLYISSVFVSCVASFVIFFHTLSGVLLIARKSLCFWVNEVND